MATEVINVKLDSKFLKEIDKAVEKNNYHNRTEYIREALRVKVDESQMKELRAHFDSIRAKHGKKYITDEELERIREKTSREFESARSKIKFPTFLKD